MRSMRTSSFRHSLLAALALALSSAAAACSAGPAGPVVGEPRGEGASGGSGDSNGTTPGAGPTGPTGSSPTSPGSPGATGGTTPTSADGGAAPSGPPPSQPPTPGGFQLTIAPLLDAQGCTECHHHGRPIDMTTYPFMTGTPATAAQALVTSLTTNMPPAPRTAVAQTVIDQVNAWVAAGMKP